MNYRIKPQHNLSFDFHELWNYRDLFLIMASKEIKIRYKQAVLGFLWAILQPILMTLVMTFFILKMIPIDSNGLPYPLFVFLGLMIWNIFSSGISFASNSVLSNANLLKKVYFPRIILPLSGIMVQWFDFFMSLMVFLVLATYYGYLSHMWPFLTLLPISLLLVSLTTMGIGMFFASLNIKYRDFQYVVPFFIQLLLFVNPIFYSDTKWQQPLLIAVRNVNPVGQSISILRSAVNGTPVDGMAILSSGLVALAIFLFGLYFFKRTERYIADLL